MGDLGCDIVGVSDRDEGIAKARAERFGSTPFTDYRRMIETTRPEFVVALGRYCEMPETFIGDQVVCLSHDQAGGEAGRRQ